MSRPNYKVRIKQKRHSIIIFMSLFIFISIIVVTISRTETVSQDPDSPANESLREPPIIIWFYSGEHGSTESLKVALRSGLITHVMVLYRNRKDGTWYSKKTVHEAIRIVKNSDAKLIWSRSLWPYYNIKGSGKGNLVDPAYFIREINTIRNEAKQMGADFVALDIEANANSPLKSYLGGNDRIRLKQEQLSRIERAVDAAIARVGRVDFVLPAASTAKDHPWNILVKLGKLRISEHTYYDNEKMIKNLRYPYDIFGAFLNPVKANEREPRKPYFLPSEIFRKSDYWSNKKGLFLYTSKPKSLRVAQMLVEYAQELPVISIAIEPGSEPNQP